MGHIERDAGATTALEAAIFHLAGRVGDDDLARVEFHAVARVRQDLGDETFELDQIFLCHRVSLDRYPRAILARRTACVIAPCRWRTPHEADAGDVLGAIGALCRRMAVTMTVAGRLLRPAVALVPLAVDR